MRWPVVTRNHRQLNELMRQLDIDGEVEWTARRKMNVILTTFCPLTPTSRRSFNVAIKQAGRPEEL